MTELQITGRAGVPNNASAVVLNLTALDATAAGYVTAYPCGSTLPDVSNLNYTPGNRHRQLRHRPHRHRRQGLPLHRLCHQPHRRHQRLVPRQQRLHPHHPHTTPRHPDASGTSTWADTDRAVRGDVHREHRPRAFRLRHLPPRRVPDGDNVLDRRPRPELRYSGHSTVDPAQQSGVVVLHVPGPSDDRGRRHRRILDRLVLAEAVVRQRHTGLVGRERHRPRRPPVVGGRHRAHLVQLGCPLVSAVRRPGIHEDRSRRTRLPEGFDHRRRRRIRQGRQRLDRRRQPQRVAVRRASAHSTRRAVPRRRSAARSRSPTTRTARSPSTTAASRASPFPDRFQPVASTWCSRTTTTPPTRTASPSATPGTGTTSSYAEAVTSDRCADQAVSRRVERSIERASYFVQCSSKRAPGRRWAIP